jgi:hypothetical protein
MGNFCRFIPITLLISALICVSTLYMAQMRLNINPGDLVLAKNFGGQIIFFSLEPWTYLPASCFGTLFRHPLVSIVTFPM